MFIVPLITKAQKYYAPEELEISWKYWTSQSDWYYLIGNGKKLTYSCVPNLSFDGIGLTNCHEIVTTYCHNNKFLVLTFNDNQENIYYKGIRIRYGSSANSNLYKLLPTYPYVSSQPWYEIDFENIIYDPAFNRIMIPIGIDENGYHNAICIGFNSSSRIASHEVDDSDFDESKIKYYNVKGQQIDVNNVSDGIIIMTDGKKAKKIMK